MIAATTSATMMPTPSPGPPTSVATTNPVIEATAPTDRSMPPVSIVSVWQPARIASGTAARVIVPIHWVVTMPGRTSSLTTTRMPRSTSSGTMGRSRKRRRQPLAVSHGLRVRGASATLVTPASAGSG